MICLKNDKELGIFNGGMFEITSPPRQADDRRCLEIEVSSLDIEGLHADVIVPEVMFGGGDPEFENWEWRGKQQFDFGYAITAHKAQGSQWGRVVVFDESGVFREDAWRWLYTSITRAADQLIVVKG
ncbi:MAG: ATP-binding domain-containing protein [Loktanella sp.]|nr:ATP-binding domain-containing protein [Loktanella sp.]